MALNFCVECDKGFNETSKNPGNLCPDCKEETNVGNFEEYMMKKAELMEKDNDRHY